MSTLYVYACSFGLLGSTEGPFAHQWNNNAGWPRLLADSLGMSLVNRSLAGTNNDQIISRFALDMSMHTPDDIVIVQWTHLHRASRVHEPYTIFPHDKDDIAKLYYEYVYDELHAVEKVATSTYWMSAVSPAKFVFSTIDDVERWRMVNERVYNTIKNYKGWVTTPNSVLNDGVLFSCKHPNHEGHKLIARYYENVIRTM
jgi:hypothetical protein